MVKVLHKFKPWCIVPNIGGQPQKRADLPDLNKTIL